jgi:hypothetical protein
MSVFPDVIKVKIIDSKTKRPVPNIAVKIKLFAHRKNDYVLLLPISTENGIIEFTKDWLIKEIEIERNFFLMDYSSTLEDCQPRFELRVLDKEDVKGTVRAMNLYKNSLGTKHEDIDRLAKADNYKYRPVSKTVTLHGDKLLEVELQVENK